MGGKRQVPSSLQRLLDWDVIITNKIHSAFIKHFGSAKKHETTFKALEYSGHGIIWIVLLLTVTFLCPSTTVRNFTINIFIAQLVDLIIVSVIKAATRRRRPAPLTNFPLTIDAVDKYSFPSGHASKTAVVATLISMQYDLSIVFEALLYSWFMAVSISRLLSRRHHLLDVVAGVVIGWAEALLIVFTGLWLSPEFTNAIVDYFLDETREGASFDV